MEPSGLQAIRGKPAEDCENGSPTDELTDHSSVSPTRAPPPKRVDIQVLRALAVTLVVLYHLDLEQFKGGFIGVDIFFVISGYSCSALWYIRHHARCVVE
jgi:hypothetical protein